jgi:hypothetical protein
MPLPRPSASKPRKRPSSEVAAAAYTVVAMPDYGHDLHDLLFGTFISPVAQRPQHAVELALVADRRGCAFEV